MIYLPSPSLEQSAEELPVDYLFFAAANYIRYWCAEGGSGYIEVYWKYHKHQLARYGLLCAERALTIHARPKYAVWSFQHINRAEVLDSKRYYKMILNEYPDTKLPEWVGDPNIHTNHKEILNSGFPWAGDILVPQVNMKARLKRIQPLIRNAQKKKEEENMAQRGS